MFVENQTKRKMIFYMNTNCYAVYLPVEDASLFTAVLLPEKEGHFPIVLMRNPYVGETEGMSDQEVIEFLLQMDSRAKIKILLEHGYAVIWQQCRGCGKSTGEFIPFRYERNDGLALQEWVRHQPFYNGELYLYGGSYTAGVHFLTAPFASDIKGAVLEVMINDCYHATYRNGSYKMGLHGLWYSGVYKNKSIRKKNYCEDSFRTLPLSDFSQVVFGNYAEDFDEMLRHPQENDPFWEKYMGIGLQEANETLKHANIPILLVTGFYDVFLSANSSIWDAMDSDTKRKSALVICPYDHDLTADNQPLCFPDGDPKEIFGEYVLQWFQHIRKKGNAPVSPGMITYYRLFENCWSNALCSSETKPMIIQMGQGTASYMYNPYAPARFKGGLSTNFGGAAFQDPPGIRYDVLTFYSSPFTEDCFVKGKMSVRLQVCSDCEDTCFYVRISLAKAEGDYGLRDDIRNLSDANSSYEPGSWQNMDFSFDEHAFLIQKEERIRIDISSSSFPFYVPHTNCKGLFSQQTVSRSARNSICWDNCFLTLPLEKA